MWSFLLLWSCMRIIVDGAPKTIMGHTGERLDIRCSYESGYESHSKYFCKGECKFGNKNIIVESGSPAKDERFSLTDDKRSRVFTVTITDLRTEDEGLYWCAVERTLTDVYSEIVLLVKQVIPLDVRTTDVPTISLFSETSTCVSSAPLTPQTLSAQTSAPDAGSFVIIIIIIITAGGLVLLLICAVLLIVAVRKQRMCGLFLTIRKRENTNETENPARSNDGSAANTETADTDPDYMNVAAAARNNVDPDHIYTDLNTSRQCHIYQSLTTNSLQEESIYDIIH